MSSSNAANSYTSGLKGASRNQLDDDHVPGRRGVSRSLKVVGGKIVTKNVPALTALNERLRDDYIEEIGHGVARWKRVIDNAGHSFRLTCRIRASIARSAISQDIL